MTDKIKFIYDTLKEKFPSPSCELKFKNNYELLISVILSAQCTDKRVNLVTPNLFKAYPTVFDMAKAKQKDLEEMIRPCGFFHNKAKNIIGACKDISEKFNGEIPNDYESLLSLSGVGRKTANVVLSVGFGKDAIAVDTHVYRVSKRLGLAKENTPEKVEKELQKVLPQNLWSEMHFLMVLFGRYWCKSQKPLCDDCKFKEICVYYKNKVKN
ncbi:MAG: endonuclease III [Christensenellales bacterium]